MIRGYKFIGTFTCYSLVYINPRFFGVQIKLCARRVKIISTLFSWIHTSFKLVVVYSLYILSKTAENALIFSALSTIFVSY